MNTAGTTSRPHGRYTTSAARLSGPSRDRPTQAAKKAVMIRRPFSFSTPFACVNLPELLSSMNNAHPSHFDLQAAAKQIMLENGFEPDFPRECLKQLAGTNSAPNLSSPDVRDLRHLLWSSIDNDTSRDLDQIEYAEKLPDGTTKVMVGIADVDAFVRKDTPIDRHAAKETCTVYTGVRNFPMLPEELSTGTTSLLEVDGKLSVVTEFAVDGNGEVQNHDIYRALVVNKAQLTYNAVGAWLEGKGAAPAKVAASAELQAQLKLQDSVAQALKNQRHQHGALEIETTEVHPIVLND